MKTFLSAYLNKKIAVVEMSFQIILNLKFALKSATNFWRKKFL